MHPTALLDLALQTLQDGGNAVLAAWSAFSRPAAAMAVTAFWQGAAVALGLALCLRLAPRSPARHRFALWAGGFGVLAALQVLPLLSRLAPAHFAATGGSVAAMGAAAASHPWIQLSAGWSLAIAAVWLAASFYRAADLAVHSLHLRKLWKTAIPVQIDPASLPRSLSRISRPKVQICTTGELERPSVIGFFAPRILIPDWLFPRLTPGELDQILLHETEHLRRRDDWTNLLQKLCLVLFPLNPGLAWIERRLCREREMACDDGVIRITRAPRAYAACLASLAERGLERRSGMLSLGAWQARPELVRRVHSILRHKHALNPLAARAVLGALGCVLVAGAMALAHCPRLVAFEPTPSAAAAQISSTQLSIAKPSSALDGSDHASAMQRSSAHVPAAQGSTSQALAASDAYDFSRAENLASAALKGQNFNRTENLASAASDGHDFSRAENLASAALKGHDFSRAEKNVKASRALAPEGLAFRALALSNTNRAASALATSASRHSTASPQSGTAAESASVRRGADPAFRSGDSFIVMSTWESFEVTAPEECPKAAEGKAPGCIESVHVAGPANPLAARRITPRITVTRMFLKIYSAGDKGSTWLVFQL